MFTAFSSRARLLDSVWLLSLLVCPMAGSASIVQQTTMTEPLSLSPPEENKGCLLGSRGPRLYLALTIDVLPLSNHCVPFDLAPVNVSHLRLFSMIYCSKLRSEATGFASSLLGFSMRLSRLTTCRESIVALVSISKNLCTEEELK